MKSSINAILVGLALAGSAIAQVHPLHLGAHPGGQKANLQKNPQEESGRRNPQPEGGYAAPPRTGELSGPTNSIGIQGLQIELPALKLALPSLRLPSLTRFHRRPQMMVDSDIAPFVDQFRREMHVPAPESGRRDGDNLEEESGQREKQKAEHWQRAGSRHSNDELARREQRLEQKINQLEGVIHQLASQLESRRAEPGRPPAPAPAMRRMQPAPLPPSPTRTSTHNAIRPTSYLEPAYFTAAPFAAAPSTPNPANTLSPAPPIKRLPPTR